MAHSINPTLTSRHKDIIAGTILGGSTIIKNKNSKNAYLSMRSKKGQWLDYKSYELSILGSEEPITIEKTNRWHSLCYPIFNEYHKIFWDKDKNRIIIKENILNLNYLSYMIWFGDSGKYINNHVILNTNIWGLDNSKIIVSVFKKVGFNSEIIFEKIKNIRIKLDQKSSYEFMKNISMLMPHFLSVELSDKINNLNNI